MMKITSPPQQSVLSVLCRRFLRVVAVVTVGLIVTISKTTTTTISSGMVVSSFPVPSGSGHRHTTTDRTSILYGGFFSDFFNEGKAKLMKSMAGEYDSSAVQQQINTYIQNNPVLMFSFDTCPYCIKAKSILDSKNIQYTNIDLRKDVADGMAIRAELGSMIGRTSVPAIWIKQQYIGGCNDGGPNNGGINSLNENGQLDQLLQQAGVL